MNVYKESIKQRRAKPAVHHVFREHFNQKMAQHPATIAILVKYLKILNQLFAKNALLGITKMVRDKLPAKNVVLVNILQKKVNAVVKNVFLVSIKAKLVSVRVFLLIAILLQKVLEVATLLPFLLVGRKQIAV